MMDATTMCGFDYAWLEESAFRDVKSEGATAEAEEQVAGRVREVYERAVAQVPPGGYREAVLEVVYLSVAGLCTVQGN
jgi:crooked neck